MTYGNPCAFHNSNLALECLQLHLFNLVENTNYRTENDLRFAFVSAEILFLYFQYSYLYKYSYIIRMNTNTYTTIPCDIHGNVYVYDPKARGLCMTIAARPQTTLHILPNYFHRLFPSPCTLFHNGLAVPPFLLPRGKIRRLQPKEKRKEEKKTQRAVKKEGPARWA